MSKERILKLEERCLENIQKQNFTEFMLNYNLYNTFGGSSAYLKAYMLILLLSSDNGKGYYVLIQTITTEELDNEYIKIVLNLERQTNTGNLKKLESMIKNCKYPEIIPLIKQVYINQKNSCDNLHNMNLNNEEKQHVNHEGRIKEMVYVSNTSFMF